MARRVLLKGKVRNGCHAVIRSHHAVVAVELADPADACGVAQEEGGAAGLGRAQNVRVERLCATVAGAQRAARFGHGNDILIHVGRCVVGGHVRAEQSARRGRRDVEARAWAGRRRVVVHAVGRAGARWWGGRWRRRIGWRRVGGGWRRGQRWRGRRRGWRGWFG